MNNDWKPTEQNIGQPVKPSGDNPPYPLSKKCFAWTPSPAEMQHLYSKWYDIDTTKLKSVEDVGALLSALSMQVSPTYKYFDEVKKFLIIPEQPKTLDEIKEEFDEKIDKLIEKTKGKFEYFKIVAEDRYNTKFDRIIRDFEYAVKNGEFAPKVDIGTLSGSYLVSNGGGVEWQPSFVIKQGNKHEGYYTFGNGRYFKYYIHKKPNFVSRFFMDKLLGFKWIDEKNDQ